MFDLGGYAVRKDQIIHVSLSGLLTNSFVSVRITDKYPGGNRYYVEDPGSAQVFIELTQLPQPAWCVLFSVRWSGELKIIDKKHEVVNVYVNENLSLELEIKTEPEEFIVAAFVDFTDETAYQGCSIFPADAPDFMTHRKVFGPASALECKDWIKKECRETPVMASAGEDIWPWQSLAM